MWNRQKDDESGILEALNFEMSPPSFPVPLIHDSDNAPGILKAWISGISGINMDIKSNGGNGIWVV